MDKEKLYLEYYKTLDRILLVGILIYIISLVILAVDNKYILNLNFYSQLYNLSSKDFILYIFILWYLYEAYKIINNKVYIFSLKEEGIVENSIFLSVSIVEKIINNSLTIILIFIIIAYYLEIYIGVFYTFIVLILIFAMIQIIFGPFKKIIDLHRKIIQNYGYYIKFFSRIYYYDDKYVIEFINKAYSNIIGKFPNVEFIQKIKDYIYKLYRLRILIFSILVSIFVIFPISIIIFLFVLSMLYAFIKYSSKRKILEYKEELNSQGINNIENKTLNFNYIEAYSNIIYLYYRLIEIIRLPLIAIFFVLLLSTNLLVQLPLIPKFIIDILIIDYSLGILIGYSILLKIPSLIKYLELENGIFYTDILLLEETKDYLIILDQSNNIIKIYKNKIVEMY